MGSLYTIQSSIPQTHAYTLPHAQWREGDASEAPSLLGGTTTAATSGGGVAKSGIDDGLAALLHQQLRTSGRPHVPLDDSRVEGEHALIYLTCSLTLDVAQLDC